MWTNKDKCIDLYTINPRCIHFPIIQLTYLSNLQLKVKLLVTFSLSDVIPCNSVQKKKQVTGGEKTDLKSSEGLTICIKCIDRLSRRFIRYNYSSVVSSVNARSNACAFKQLSQLSVIIVRMRFIRRDRRQLKEDNTFRCHSIANYVKTTSQRLDAKRR